MKNIIKTPPAQSFRFPPRPRGIKGEFSGFTLVELIVVITILTILGTIGFMSFNGYQLSTRDSVRVSDMKNAETGLELYFVKAGSYPLPDNATIFTGSTGSIIQQGILGESVSRNIKLSRSITDPLTKENYTYSVFNDGKYYQLASSLEHTTSYNSNQFIQQAIAADATSFKTTKVIGNYKIDPSLPSLIIVPYSYNTSSGIFDPNVCFVMDSGKNTLSTCAEKKKDMNLKDYDNSLVGYWDMETCDLNCTASGSIMKDLTGNSNSGLISGTGINSTGGVLGKGLSFSGDINSYVKILKDTGSILNSEEITVNVIFKPKITSKWGQIIGDTKAYGAGYCSNFHIGYSLNTHNPPLLMVSSFNNTIYFGSYSANDIDNKFISVYFVRKDGIGKTYLNGNKIYEKAYDRTKFFPNSNPFIIGAGSYAPASVQTTGTIDDIKIYDRALSDSEILQQAKIAGF